MSTEMTESEMTEGEMTEGEMTEGEMTESGMTESGMTDAVWWQLDPHAGRLSRRSTRRLLLAAIIAALLLGAAGVVERSGLVTAKLVWPQDNGWETTAANHVIVHSVTVENTGWVPLTVIGAGRDGPGLSLVRVDGDFPNTVAAGGRFTFTLTYEVIDCAAVSANEWPVPLRVNRWWGTQTQYVNLPDAPVPYGPIRPWQRALADQAC